MKLFAFLITNNKVTAYGGVQPLRQAVLFVFGSFDKNTLGDIIAIRDELGNVVAKYIYDAWGNILHEEGSMASVNPFRYRGYYYDVETGFYYLQTRYYDPTICRFINADNYELVGELSQTAGQLNLYAYANNNPVMLTDETGEGILTTMIIIAILGTSLVCFSGDSPRKTKQSLIVKNDININNMNPEGSIKVNIDGTAIEIMDSWKITEDYDRKRIMELIMESEPYQKYQYNRSMESYLAEWEVHNHFYYMGIKKTNAQHVYLNRTLVGGWQLTLEKIAYGIYGFIFVG